AAFGGAEGRHAADPVPAGRSTAERARISGNTTAASTGSAVARDERAAAAVADRHVDNTAFGRDRTGDAITGAWERQARDGAIANPRSKGGATIIAASGDDAGASVVRTRRQCQARNACFAGCDHALSRGRAGNVNTGGWRTCQTQNAATANARRQAVGTD